MSDFEPGGIVIDDVVILAGGRVEGAFREATGVDWRGDLVLGGRSLLERVLGAVSGFGEPLVVGGRERPGRWVEGGATFVESLSRANVGARGERWLLVTVDSPFLTEAGVRRFVGDCDLAAGINYPYVPVEDCERAFPGLERTALRLREGRFTGGNLGLVSKEAMGRALPVVEQAYAARKSPLALGRMVGWGLVGRLVLGRIWSGALSVGGLERSVSRFLGTGVRGVLCHDAGVGTDVDSLEQYLAILRVLESGERSDS